MPYAAFGYQVDGDEPKDEEDQAMEPKEENGMDEAVTKEGLVMPPSPDENSFAFLAACGTMYSGDGEAEAEGEEGKDDVKEEEDEGSRTRISGTGFYTTRHTRHLRRKSSKLSARICRKLRFGAAREALASWLEAM